MSSPTPPGRGGLLSPNVMHGVLWALLAGMLYSLVPVGVRLVSDRLPAIEIVFLRNFFGFLLFLAIYAWRGGYSLRTRRFGFHLQRNIFNFIGMWLWFAALAMMPLGKAVALHFTEPLWVAVLAILFLGERPGKYRWGAIAVGFCGALIILRPGAIPIGLAALMVLGSAFCYATVVIYSRSLARTDSPATTTFYYQGMLMVFAFFPMLWVWVMPGWQDVPGLLLLTTVGTAAPYCIIRAFKYAEASVISPLSFMRLPVTAIFAYLIFSEATGPWVWVGAVVIFTAAYMMTRGEIRAAAK
ncbi:MAG: DMT family transporter [Alphaproteobacteria bacterium]